LAAGKKSFIGITGARSLDAPLRFLHDIRSDLKDGVLEGSNDPRETQSEGSHSSDDDASPEQRQECTVM